MLVVARQCFAAGAAEGDRTRMSDPYGPLTAPSLATFEDLAGRALAGLPEAFRAPCEGLAVRVADFAAPEVLADLGLEDPFELTGLYQGTALTEKSVFDVATEPDTIWLYRRPILEEWIERGEVTLEEMITHVLVHEIAHHFGMDDDEIAAIDDWRI